MYAAAAAATANRIFSSSNVHYLKMFIAIGRVKSLTLAKWKIKKGLSTNDLGLILPPLDNFLANPPPQPFIEY